MSEETRVKVIEIDPTCKYAIVTSEMLTDDELRYLIDRIRDWWHGYNQPFVLLNGVQLVRLDKEPPQVIEQKKP